MEELANFQDITVAFDKIEKDPDHHERVLYLFVLTPASNEDWREVFRKRIWPLGQSFAPHIAAAFPNPAMLTLACHTVDEAQSVAERAKQSVASTNSLYRELLQSRSKRLAREENEAQGRESERDRIIKENTDRLKGGSS